MYLGIDVGGTKTLVAVFSDDGQIIHEEKIQTPPEYADFIKVIEPILHDLRQKYSLNHACCAIPGSIDRQHGIGLRFGNLDWKDIPAKDDLTRLLGGLNVLVENDANLAGLSEALLVQDKYKVVLYLTISTGVGSGFIVNGKIDDVFADSEAGQMVLNYKGELKKWEEFASGKALVAKYGKKASEIDDPAIWEEFCYGLAQGIDVLVSTTQPDVIILGGGVGAHFEKFANILANQLKKFENEMVKMPPVIKAQRPEEAVIYGCYALARAQQN